MLDGSVVGGILVLTTTLENLPLWHVSYGLSEVLELNLNWLGLSLTDMLHGFRIT